MQEIDLVFYVLFGAVIVGAEVLALHWVFRRNVDYALDRATSRIKDTVKEMGGQGEIQNAINEAMKSVEYRLFGDDKTEGLIDELPARFIQNPEVQQAAAQLVAAFGAAMSNHARASRAGSAPRRRSGGILDEVLGLVTQLAPGMGGGGGIPGGINAETLVNFAQNNPEQAKAFLDGYLGQNTPQLNAPQINNLPWGR